LKGVQIVLNGSLQKKGNVYYAVVSTKDGYGNYKPKWISTKCQKKRDAQKELNRILNELENGDYINKNNILFADYLEYWLNNIIINEVEKSTWESYTYNINNHILPYFKEKSLKLQDIGTIHMQNYFNEKYANGRKDGKGGLSANLLKKHHANMKKALDYAIKIGYIRTNPISFVAMPKKKKFVGKILTVDEVERLLHGAKGSHLESLIMLTVNYGLRRGEVLGLRWQDIDFEAKSLTICNTRIKMKEKIEKQPKNESSLRTLPLIPHIETYLRNLKRQQAADNELMGNCYIASDYVCRCKDGTPINIDSCNHAFKTILRKNELPDIRLHDLRHCTASILLKNGASMKDIQIWLGHSDIGTTMNIYAHVDFEMKKTTANLMGSMNFDIK